jgi:hypothetical protein
MMLLWSKKQQKATTRHLVWKKQQNDKKIAPAE